MQITEGSIRRNIKHYTDNQRPNCPPPSPTIDISSHSDDSLIDELQSISDKHKKRERF